MSFQDLGRRRVGVGVGVAAAAAAGGDKEQKPKISKMVIHLAKPRSPPGTITTTTTTTTPRHSHATTASNNTRSPQPSRTSNNKVRPPPKTTRTMSNSTKPRAPTPAITTRCPVTSRSLMDDLSSFGGDGQILPNQSPSCDVSEAPTAYDEDPMLPIVTPRETRIPSIYAQLTTEIASYHRMVSELESILVPSSSHPEAQWRSRILIRSAKDADRDIWRRLYEYEANFGDGSSHHYSRAQIASRKLHRDFRRVHKHLIQVMGAYHLRQQVDVSFLSSTSANANAGEEKEEFFDRAMRERHEEVNQIHSSMHKVNAIYTDLAGLVEGQQEHIDKVAEKINYSRGATHAGADRLHKATMGMCAPMNGFDIDTHTDTHTDTHGHVQPPAFQNYRVDEDFSWTMPFETIQDDLRSVRMDVMKLGKELVEDFQENVHQSIMQNTSDGGMGFNCVSMGGNVDSTTTTTTKVEQTV